MDKLDGHPDFLGEFVPDNAGESDALQEMQRYDLYESEMIDDSEGKYVLHDDAQSEIARLRAENESLLEMAYCQKIGTDTAHGLSSCDNFKDWLAALQPNTSHQTADETDADSGSCVDARLAE